MSSLSTGLSDDMPAERTEESSHKPCCECDVKKTIPRGLCGFVTMLAIAGSWVAATQFAQNTYHVGVFRAPLFLVYFYTAWLLLCYPGYLLVVYIQSKGQLHIKGDFSESLKLYKKKPFKFGLFFGKSMVFVSLWTGAMYTYARALDPDLLNASDVTALFATNHSFFYMLSWIVLFEKFVAIRILAMIFSITGVILFAYVDGFGSMSMWGVILAVASSAAAAVYKVLFKRFVGEPTLGQLSLFLSIIGLLSTVFLWPLLLVIYLTNTEQLNFPAAPWNDICAAIALALVYQLLVNYFLVLSYPQFMGLGIAVGIPLCTVADYHWKGREFDGMEIGALVLITVGLLLVLLPEQWNECCPEICSAKGQAPDLEASHEGPRSRLHRMSQQVQ